jgi:hypothetical protein
MEFNVAIGEHATPAALCGQRYAVISTDETAIGTERLMGCTGLIVFPKVESGTRSPSGVGHVEARDAKVYQGFIKAGLEKMLAEMRRGDGSRMALVLLGALSSGSDDHKSLQKIFTDMQFAEGDILDLRSGGAGVGSGTHNDDVKVPDRLSGCVFRPRTGVIEVFGLGSQPSGAKGGRIICIQDAENDLSGVESKASGCKCVIL